MLDNKFFEPEKINDYYVDKNMKKVWACEIDLLEKFIRVCEKYKLKYYMAGGSLIGTIRHQGFIPWDDDIDIDMFRDDYERFCEIAPKEFNGKYFFQSTYTDKHYVRPHVQIRNSETTAIMDHEKGLPFNQGIFIDIFPLDAVPRNKVKQKIQSTIMFYMMNFLRAGIMVNPKFNQSFFKNIAHYIAVPFFKLIDFHVFFKWFEKVATYYDHDKSLCVGEISFDYRDKCIWKREWFDEIILKPYHDLMVAVPKDYDKVLTKTFGDYMIPVKDPSYHSHIIFDTKISYKKKLQELFGID